MTAAKKLPPRKDEVPGIIAQTNTADDVLQELRDGLDRLFHAGRPMTDVESAHFCNCIHLASEAACLANSMAQDHRCEDHAAAPKAAP